MNIFRNKYVVIGLAVAALAMLANSLRPMWQRRRPAAPSAPAPAQAAAPAAAPVASNAPGSAAARQQVEAVQPARGIDLEQVGWRVDGAPRRDPFQVMGPAPGNLSRLYPSATELLTLRAIWWQSGTILAEVNNRIVREGNTITAAKGDAITEFKILNIGAERIWVEGPGGEEQLPFDPTLSLRGINVKLTEGTNDSFAAAKARLDWPYRIVNGITNDAYG